MSERSNRARMRAVPAVRGCALAAAGVCVARCPRGRRWRLTVGCCGVCGCVLSAAPARYWKKFKHPVVTKHVSTREAGRWSLGRLVALLVEALLATVRV